MKKFIIKLFMLGVISLLLASAIDFGYSKILMRSNERRFEVWYDLMHGKIDADIIINGNSRTWQHINPRILDSVLNTNSYNLGINGSMINRQIRRYRLFEKYNKYPKLIIQNIDYFSLGDDVGFEREQFYPYFWNLSMRKEFYETEPISFSEKYIPLVRYGGLFDLSYCNSIPRYLEKGFKGLNMKWDGKKYNEIDSITFSYSDSTLKMLNKYLADMTNNGIKILFVYAPIYIGVTHKMTNQNEMYAVYKKIADKYDIPILDYTYMGICSDTTYFYNALHLNKKGAEIFSDSLANDLKCLHIIN